MTRQQESTLAIAKKTKGDSESQMHDRHARQCLTGRVTLIRIF
jgi:hypothetical protein